MEHSSHVTLNGQELTLHDTDAIAAGATLKIASSAEHKVHLGRKVVEKLAYTDKPYYGINTGFGYFAGTTIPHKSLIQLQENILTSHAGGWGGMLSLPETRLAMALRLNVLIQGFTGVRYALCEKLLEFINTGIYPLIPLCGSVGASGDLIPLAHLALPLIGMGMVSFQGETIEAARALELAGIAPIKLAEKEGLSLINGTQIMLSIGALALSRALKLMEAAELITALSYEALTGHPRALDGRLHAVRRQAGQLTSAKIILRHLEGSYLFGKTVKRARIQDPYSLRCAPQVHGASRDALGYIAGIVERELNAVTDNPLVFPGKDEVVSGGNFHGQPLAMAFDFGAIAIAELASISERRLELLLNPGMNGLTPFLSSDPGLDSGYMCTQYLSASLVNENKTLANPACTDSIPGNAGIEDHVSMGMNSAKKFKAAVENTLTVLSLEMLAAAQAIDLKQVKKLGAGTQILYEKIRKEVAFWTGRKQILSEEVCKARNVLEQHLSQS